MRKILLAAVGFAALTGVGGLALAQSQGDAPARHGAFQSDANNDGVLTRQEFDAGRTATFARLDTNNDGQLTREERRAERGDRHGRRGGRHGGMHSLERVDANSDGNITRDEFLARPTQMFDRLDANDDGVISTAERPQRREHAEGERRERPSRVNPDTNGDNQISSNEFAAMGSGMFERLDANSDGRVTREEAEAARPHHRGQ